MHRGDEGDNSVKETESSFLADCSHLQTTSEHLLVMKFSGIWRWREMYFFLLKLTDSLCGGF